MAQMAIRVSGQHQKQGASLADEIANWLWQFSGDPLPPPSSSRTLFPSPSPPLSLFCCRCRRRRLYLIVVCCMCLPPSLSPPQPPPPPLLLLLLLSLLLPSPSTLQAMPWEEEEVLMGLALSCATHRASGGCPNPNLQKSEFGGNI